MTDDDTKPTGYDTLREALAVIIEHEAERARAHPNSNRWKLSLPKANTAAWPEDVIDADAGWPPLVILPK